MTRHNLSPNPACGVAVTGWGGGSVPTRSTGLAGLPVTTGAHYGVGGFAQTPAAAAAAGLAYTGSLYANNGTPFAISTSLFLAFRRSAGGDDFSQTAPVTFPIGVSRIAITGTAPANTTGVYLIIDSFRGDFGAGVDLTACLIEQAAATGTYFDGDSPGATWDGAPGLSPSSLPDTPVGPAVTVWTGTAEVPATVTLWTGAAEVPAAVASIT